MQILIEALIVPYRINRNIVECKYQQRHIHCDVACVLIETLWNVNAE